MGEGSALEQQTPENGQGSGVDLSALLEMITGSGQEGEKPGGGMDFASLLGMLGGLGGIGGGEEKPAGPPPPNESGEGFPAFDPALLTTFHRAMKTMREPDKNIRLLQALRPFLEPERQWKVDEAVKFLHLMKLAPLLQNLPLGGE